MSFTQLAVPMNTNETPQTRPEPQQASGAHADRRYARRIDCTERPRHVQSADAIGQPPPPRDDAHR
ncbi:hypothetical protein [Longimicrobium sp.]|uniref:hypothetical protein n=1 Tax=Longimicrobium sp. TaxID=2029185 RepID=UPI003B3A3DB1